ncbi:DMT family transporter [Pararhodobacter zhoushanensis]|uniref:DMT family transporter n=1 Tax=Pararhodobacter zhoushanensis TaxID=2479545 RepID=A0ABT3GYS6_9RHOB|nr:DMT family transporter [Pararhodobacter zhoushanensis]MCW1932720.1 DMT family transporter [Pararhodobacter zhoushanensis]
MRSTILIAVVSMLGCTMLVAGTSLIAKALGSGALGTVIHPLMVSQARFVFGFLAVAVVLSLRLASGRKAWVQSPQTPKPNWTRHALRTLLGWTGGGLMFAAAAQLPLADVNALSFTSPVATMLFAMLLLGERVGPWRWGAAVIAMLGALVLLRPGAGVIQPAALLAVGAAVAMGIEAIVIKRLATSEPPGRTMLINNAMGAVLSSVVALTVFVWPQGATVWAGLIGMGVVMVTAQILLLGANRLVDASFVAPFFYLTLVWAAVYDIVFFDVWPDAVSLTGASIVIAGGLVMTWREVLNARRAAVPASVTVQALR